METKAVEVVMVKGQPCVRMNDIRRVFGFALANEFEEWMRVQGFTMIRLQSFEYAAEMWFNRFKATKIPHYDARSTDD